MSKATKLINSTIIKDGSDLEEGIGSIAASKLADLAHSFIFKPRPIIILHNPVNNQTVTFKMKRGLVNHSLILDEEGKGDRIIAKMPSATALLLRAIAAARKWNAKGFVEI